MKKRVYICAPLGGNIRANIENAKDYTRYALQCDAAPVTPHLYALCLDDPTHAEQELIMNAGMSLLWFCDELWVFGEDMTDSMRTAISFCQTMRLPIRRIESYQVYQYLKKGKKKRS